MNPTKLIATYARVSTSNQEDQKTIQTQIMVLKELAKNKGYTISKEYTDEGWSGDTLVRPALDELRMDAKKKIWEAVLIYDPDRLARRYSYQELVTDELREAGIEVIFVTTPAPKDGIEKILYGVQGLFAEYERAKIAERFRLGKVRKANEGHIIASEAPYGYTFIVKNGKRGDADFKNGYYEINEEEAQIVKRIFFWVANEGLTLRAVVKRLQELGISPRKSKRGVWSTSTLSTLLRNKTYIGEAHFGASYAVVPINPLKKDGYKRNKKSSRKNKPESDWIKIKTPVLIEEALFEHAQKRLKLNFELCARNTKNEYLLSHKIYCPCGSRRAGEGPQHGKHLYYRCISRVKSYPLPSSCIEKGLNARIVDDLVWRGITKLMSSPALLAKQAKRWLNNQSKNPTTSTINIEETRKQIVTIEKQCERYTQAYASGIINMEGLKCFTDPLKEKISSYNKQLIQANSEIEKSNNYSQIDSSNIKAFAHQSHSILSNLPFIDKKAIISNVVERVTGTREQLQIYGYIPITSDKNVAFLTNDWYSLDTTRRLNKINEANSIPFEIVLKTPTKYKR